MSVIHREFSRREYKDDKPLTIAFMGSNNCGKTSLFNAYTKKKFHVVSWPGENIERREGKCHFHEQEIKLIDMPKLNSLTSGTREEQVTREFLLSDKIDIIINVVDASTLQRSLYLTIELIELGKPVVLALSMMDLVEKRGMEIDIHRLPEMLGIPAIPISTLKHRGLETLLHAAEHHQNKHLDHLEHHHSSGAHCHAHHEEFAMVYSDAIEDSIDRVMDRLAGNYPQVTRQRWHAIKLLTKDEIICKRYPLVLAQLSDVAAQDYETEMINQRYDFIDEIINECLVNKDIKSRMTDCIDAVVTHNIWGIPIFLAIMALIFFLTFVIGDWLKGYLVVGLGWFSDAVSSLLAAVHAGEFITSLLVDGVIAGVGGILTFLPNIFILFLALAILEDSDYMSRVAYVMDGLMSKLGLSGRAFIPMILGFGCSVPAIMAARSLEDRTDRLITILITPFMSCSARLPIYLLLSEMFFGSKAMLAAFSMYVFGLVTAILVALVLGRLLKREGKGCNSLLVELSEYKAPSFRCILAYSWDKVKGYLVNAGTVIFFASIVIWLLLNFNFSGMVSDISQSFGAYMGKVLVPVMAVCGLGHWQLVVALISGIAGKEVVVASMAVLFSISNISSANGMEVLLQALGSFDFTALNAYCMMIFCLLYTPCAASIGVMRKETESLGWTVFAIIMQLGIAWAAAALVYQLGSIFI